MSESDVDLVRQIYEEFNRTLELPRSVLSPDVEWQPPGDEPDNGLRRGPDAVTRYVREWASTFDDYHCDVQDMIERGDRVVVPVVLHGRIGDRGHELSIQLTQVWTIRDGEVVRVCEYRTKEEALAAS